MILIAWYGYMDTLEFYDAFSCDGLVAYKINDESLDGNPTYNQMNVESNHALIINFEPFQKVFKYYISELE